MSLYQRLHEVNQNGPGAVPGAAPAALRPGRPGRSDGPTCSRSKPTAPPRSGQRRFVAGRNSSVICWIDLATGDFGACSTTGTPLFTD